MRRVGYLCRSSSLEDIYGGSQGVVLSLTRSVDSEETGALFSSTRQDNPTSFAMGWRPIRTPLSLLLVLGWAMVIHTVVGAKDCPKDFFSCTPGDETSCKHNFDRCNGVVDCDNGRDEEDCPTISCDPPDYFKCKNGKCLMTFFLCDGEDDCGDWSDERDCPEGGITSAPVVCKNDEWMCLDRTGCIPNHWVCDSEENCLDGSDEREGCPTHLGCLPGQYQCENHQCIFLEKRCNGHEDCSDGSDERDCVTNVTAKDCTLERGLFLCNDTFHCLEFREVCSGTPECLDESDEGPGCRTDGCRSAGCNHKCLNTAQGALCYCPSGFQLASDGKSCIDKDECQDYGVCSHMCTNTLGSYSCKCDEGYGLQDDGHGCKILDVHGEAMLFYSTRRDVRGIYLSSNVKFSVAQNSLKHVVGVAYDGKHVYWTSIVNSEEAIMRSLEHGEEKEIIVTAGVGLPEDLALDWITGNIYFSDSEEHHVAVCNANGSLCTVLIREDPSNNPRALALLVREGLVFWTRWGLSPRIMRAGMDGSNVVEFVSKKTGWPNGLTLDFSNDRLYWVDAKLHTIESIHFSGTDRRMVLKKVVQNPYSIAVFENSLYWSDYEEREIYRCNKFTGKHIESLVKERKGYIYDIHIYHPVILAEHANPCAGADCSDMCLLAPNRTYTCACPEDMELAPNQHRCMAVSKKGMLMVGGGAKLFKIYHQTLGRQHIAQIESPLVVHIGALAYNSLTGSVFIGDNDRQQIIALNLESNEISIVANTSIGEIKGMDFDYVGNNLYWCDGEKGTLEVMSLTTMERTALLRNLGGVVPLDVAVISDDGVMFVALRGLDHPHIDRYRMDGSGTHTQVIGDLMGPHVALVYESDLHRIFYSDSGRSSIGSTDDEGMDQHHFRSLTGSPGDIAAVGQDFFWVNLLSPQKLYWSNKYESDASVKRISLDIDDSVDDVKLVAVNGIRMKPDHICQKNNGGCSHLCLLSLHQAVCSCPLGMRLRSDSKTCSSPVRCTSTQFKCKMDNLCIDKKLICDKHDDCPGGEDEENCDCQPDEFHCGSGECIDKAKHCDNHNDCSDRSDERDCAKCHYYEFQCQSGQCIKSNARCDLVEDCKDGSDEQCDDVTCKPGEFRCESGQCVPDSWECDGKEDCSDASDEHSTCRPIVCRREDQFTCTNNHCIPDEHVCNGFDDCGDNSDEYCPSTQGPQLPDDGCADGHFFCASAPKLCPLESLICDGVPNCPKGEDEQNCGCAPKEFKCRNDKCISSTWVCDGSDDCGDKSDEDTAQCKVKAKANATRITCLEFSCKSGECIGMELVCNEKDNCKDGSDERGTCDTACSAPHPCGGICRPTPNGPHCSCAGGFRLLGTACEDIDECEKGVCSQLCLNTPGSYECICGEGYRLSSDGGTCRAVGPKMDLLVASGSEILQVSRKFTDTEVAVSDPGRTVTGLDVDSSDGDVYWTSSLFGLILRMNLESRSMDTIIEGGLPGKVALDWITKNIYVVDEGIHETIKVCNFNTKFCASIVETQAPIKVTSMAVDPNVGYLFYSLANFWKFVPPTTIIYHASLCGTDREEIISSKTSYVAGMALDLVKRQVYFADQELQKIEVVNYDGSERRVVFKQGVHRPVGLVLFENNLFWLSAGSGQISRCQVMGLRPWKCNDPHVNVYGARHLVVFQEARQPQGANICLNHTCNTICVPHMDVPQCVCLNGTLVNMGQPCEEEAAVAPIHMASAPMTPPENGGHGGMVAGILFCFFAVAIIGAIYYFYLRRMSMPDLNSMYFRNPSFGLSPPTKLENMTSTTQLVPGQHQYENPTAAMTPSNQSNGQLLSDTERLKPATPDSGFGQKLACDPKFSVKPSRARAPDIPRDLQATKLNMDLEDSDSEATIDSTEDDRMQLVF